MTQTTENTNLCLKCRLLFDDAKCPKCKEKAHSVEDYLLQLAKYWPEDKILF